MVNHLRTLLLNRPARHADFSRPGEEYIPAEFVEQTLPPWLASYWGLLFGSDPEPVFGNYQVDRLLRVVHATDYAPYVLLPDSRITYEPDQPGPFTAAVPGLTWGKPTAHLTGVDPIGHPEIDAVRGVMFQRWRVDVDHRANTATAANLRTGETQTTAGVLGGPAPIPAVLPGSNVRARLRGEIADAATTLFLSVLALPDADDLIHRLNAVEQLPHYQRLFGWTAAEPLVTFRRLWDQRTVFPDRVAGLVLALGWQLHTRYRRKT